MSDIRIFYKSLDGGKNVSENFRVREFACKDGADIIPIDMELVKVLQNVRDHFKMPVTVNSAYLTPSYNKKSRRRKRVSAYSRNGGGHRGKRRTP